MALAAVVGKPDALRTEIVKAFIVLKSGHPPSQALAADIQGFVKTRLSAHEYPREVAFMDVNLCFPCGKCPEFCPVGCIEYLRPGTLPGRGDSQPVQDRFQECIGCYICVEVCALLTDYDAVRMYDVGLVEQALDVKIGDTSPEEYTPAQPYEDYFSEGGLYRHLGEGSRLRAKMNKEERERSFGKKE